ncbi:MAG: SIS domain-containing protein [Bacteroidales bacterium]|nr:SIS domain-containing protein [Bacteroidales bacterium]
MEFNTHKEILQQPQVWRKAYESIRSRKDEIKGFVDKYLNDGYQVVLTGAGSSAYIGDALECALSATRFRGARSIATTDILSCPGIYFNAASKVLLISFARSGDSPESIGAVKAVEQTAGKAAHIFITCNADGLLAKTKGDNILCVLLPPETNDLSLAMTSSCTTMLLACSMISRIDEIESQKEYIDTLSACVEKSIARYEKDLEAIASKDFKRAVFLGSGTLKGISEESRLKLQELTDGTVMCAFDSFLGFRHGPKAVINKDTLIVYLVSPNPDVRRYEMDLMKTIRKQGRYVATVTICQQPVECPETELMIETMLPAGFPDIYGCVSYLFVAQLLGYYKSIFFGLSPDSPSKDGNISRVVEGVTLYI